MERDIEATTTVRAPLATACDVFKDDPGAVFAPLTVTEGQRRNRRFTVRLTAPVGGGAGIEQEVEVDVGSVVIDDTELRVPVQWEPTGHERLLPSFDGALHLRSQGSGRTCVELRGHYQVPLGAVGRFGDAVVGRRLGRQSVSALLEHLARNLDSEVARRTEQRSLGPRPYNVDLREIEHTADAHGSPEHFIG